MVRLQKVFDYPSIGDELFTANLNCPPGGSPRPKLSGLEAQVLCLLLAGKPKDEIADEIGVDEHALKEHIRSILRRAKGYRDRTR